MSGRCCSVSVALLTPIHFSWHLPVAASQESPAQKGYERAACKHVFAVRSCSLAAQSEGTPLAATTKTSVRSVCRNSAPSGLRNPPGLLAPESGRRLERELKSLLLGHAVGLPGGFPGVPRSMLQLQRPALHQCLCISAQSACTSLCHSCLIRRPLQAL